MTSTGIAVDNTLTGFEDILQVQCTSSFKLVSTVYDIGIQVFILFNTLSDILVQLKVPVN